MVNLLDGDYVGGKLHGLLQIPKDWVPPLFAIDPELHRRYIERPGWTVPELLSSLELTALEEKLRSFGSGPEDVSLIVRSNSSGEGLQDRGLLASFRSDGTVEGVLAAASRAFERAGKIGSEPIGLLVQSYQPALLSGHLSNERRVAEELRRWMCEIEAAADSAHAVPQVLALRVERVRSASPAGIRCKTRRDLVASLRAVGAYFLARGERRHLEWAWTGERLWIVQNDLADVASGLSPGPLSTRGGAPVSPRRLKLFGPYRRSDAHRWQKLECVERFKEARLPTTDVYVLKGASLMTALAARHSPSALRTDLMELTASPLVIRTDIAGATELMAPRTDCVSSERAARRFLEKSAADLIAAGHRPREICFIAHRFIASAASAFSLASPTHSRVRIDALWGLPDGLEYCPHDSFEVSARSGSELARRVRYKPSFLAAGPDGKWVVSPLQAPWDWKPALRKDELRSIASASKALADLVGNSVVIMWFVGIPKDSGHPALLPWRYTREESLRQVDSAVTSHFRGVPLVVRNAEDVASLRNTATAPPSILLRPDVRHLRDERLLTTLASVARERAVRIDLEGSVLSHAYYVLRRAGAHVACVDPIDPVAIRRRYGKLVRDRIPVQIRKQGERARAVSIGPAELLDVLKAKMVEEALEVLWSRSPEELRGEMADVFEVLRALSRATRGSLASLKRDADKKRRRLGGFGQGVVLVETEDTPLVAVNRAGLFEPLRASLRTTAPTTVVAAGRRPKTQQDRILIPLVPSAPSRLRGPSRIHLRGLGLTFRVRYTEKFVEIVLEQDKGRGQGYNANQPTLPLDYPPKQAGAPPQTGH